MAQVTEAIVELDQLHSTNTTELEDLLRRVEIERLRMDWAERDRLEEQLGERLAHVMAWADLLGARRLLLEADALERQALGYAGGFSRIFMLPVARFAEAVADLINREPRLAPGWRATQEVYTQGGMAAARAASENVAAHIQRVVGTALSRGSDQDTVERRILAALRSASPAELVAAEVDPAGFTRSYSETVFRTLTSSSYARGRRRQAQDPVIRRATAGWRFSATGDPDTRHNHQAADGLVAHFEDPVWQSLAPPLGYRCRCSLELVPTFELRAAGLCDADGNMTARARAPLGAYADPGFTPGGGPVPG